MKSRLDLRRALSAVTMIAALLLPATAGADQFRSITALAFNYYTDDRASLDYEEVLISPLGNSFYLVTAVLGTASDFDSALGGRLGVAFDLPGYYYGEASYSYERRFEESEGPDVSTLKGALTYESNGVRASAELSGEISAETWGVTLSPGIHYTLSEKWILYGKYFAAYNRYDENQYFNHALWSGAEYAVQPTIWLHIGGTFGTVYEPENSYEKWSGIAGFRVLPAENLVIRFQFEYTANPLYEIITNGLVVDYKFY